MERSSERDLDPRFQIWKKEFNVFFLLRPGDRNDDKTRMMFVPALRTSGDTGLWRPRVFYELFFSTTYRIFEIRNRFFPNLRERYLMSVSSPPLSEIENMDAHVLSTHIHRSFRKALHFNKVTPGHYVCLFLLPSKTCPASRHVPLSLEIGMER